MPLTCDEEETTQDDVTLSLLLEPKPEVSKRVELDSKSDWVERLTEYIVLLGTESVWIRSVTVYRI